jgi:hypothetical protein
VVDFPEVKLGNGEALAPAELAAKS